VVPGCDNGSMTPPTDPAKLNAWISKNKATIVDVVKTAAEWGTEKGLKEWAKKDPAAAKEAALELCKNIDTELLPYFKDDAKLLTADEVKQLLSTSLFKKVPDPVKLAIIAASAVLDYYLPVPASGSYLTKDQKDIVCAFLIGVRNGCEDFTPPAGTKAPAGKKRALPARGWLE